MNTSFKSYASIMQGESRLAGVLLHPTSLPSGVLDGDAFKWLDFMAEAGLHLWQVLPLGTPQGNLSPYQCYSAFAINPALLAEDTKSIDLNVADENFKAWYQQQRYWLDDYATFMALKQAYENKAWFEWPEAFKSRNTHTLEEFQNSHQGQLNAIYWQQYQLHSRWQEIRNHAKQRNIYLFGDMPLFVAHDSADVWANPNNFLLDEQGIPNVVAGVPPDYFSETGQRWGNPHFNWDAMQAHQFDWWMKRLKNHFEHFDLVRIDHFRGLESVWVIDAASETAEHGVWQKVPGDKLLQCLLDEMGDIPLVAEDLGIITPEVNALRDQFNLPGMSVLHFSFDGYEDNPHKPQNIHHNRIVYTGTHDNDTTLGWYQSQNEETRQHILSVLGLDNEQDITDALIDSALNTKAQLAVIPLQDFLHLDTQARMNIPGTVDDNWQWRFNWDQLPQNLADSLRLKIENSGRLLIAQNG